MKIIKVRLFNNKKRMIELKTLNKQNTIQKKLPLPEDALLLLEIFRRLNPRKIGGYSCILILLCDLTAVLYFPIARSSSFPGVKPSRYPNI